MHQRHHLHSLVRVGLLVALLASIAVPLSQASAPAPGGSVFPGLGTPARGASRAGTTPATRPVAKVPFAEHIHKTLEALLTQLEAQGNFDSALNEARSVFDQVIALGQDRDLVAYREAAYVVRLISLSASRQTQEEKLDTFKFLRKNSELAGVLSFMIRRQENTRDILAVLDKLRAARPATLNQYASLAAALCVVHDGRQFTRSINENLTTSPDVVELYDYYVRNEARMMFGIKGMPAELLTFVVDTTTPVVEMEWALSRYAKNQDVGSLFFQVKYDTDHYERSMPKKLEGKPYTLPNILSLGGICADQAYFSSAVGKAIGVPTAYTTGQSAAAAHAWVGFLQASGRTPLWNFSTGRYEAYTFVRGMVTDPQSRVKLPDSYVSFLAEMAGFNVIQRQNAVAMTDAALRLDELETQKLTLTAPVLAAHITGARPEPRKTGIETQLAILELGLREFPAYPGGWFALQDMADAGKLTLEHKKRWSTVLQRLCGQKYPDFTMSVLIPMIQTVENTKEQNLLWNAAFALYPNRPDLCAQVRFNQAKMWETAGDLRNAGQCYENVANLYANVGPFVIEALQGASRVVVKLGAANGSDWSLYEKTWTSTKKPRDIRSEAASQSNWYRIGRLFVNKLMEANQRDRAERIRQELEQVVPARRS